MVKCCNKILTFLANFELEDILVSTTRCSKICFHVWKLARLQKRPFAFQRVKDTILRKMTDLYKMKINTRRFV